MKAVRFGETRTLRTLAIRKDGSTFPVKPAEGIQNWCPNCGLRQSGYHKQKQTEETLQRGTQPPASINRQSAGLFYFKDAQGRYLLNIQHTFVYWKWNAKRMFLEKQHLIFIRMKLAEQYFKDEMDVVRNGKAMIARKTLLSQRYRAMHWHLTSKYL